MQYKCCVHILNSIFFTRTGVKFCNKLSSINTNDEVLFEKNFYEKFLNERIKIIENCKSGVVPDYCKDCMYLEEKEWEAQDCKINYIEIFHWNQCNCACVYCGNRSETKLKITSKKEISKFIDLYPILKKFVKEKHFSDKLKVSFVGGEPTLLKEFPDILKLFIKKGYSIGILSNGILYEKLIAKALKLNPFSDVTISLDSGTPETFRKIKGIDKFDVVVKNIKKYIKESGENSRNVIIKYILIEGLNDNKEEIIKWLDLCKNIGAGILQPTIEFCHSVNDQTKIGPSEHICELYEFMKEKIVEYGFILNVYDFVEVIVKNRRYR